MIATDRPRFHLCGACVRARGLGRDAPGTFARVAVDAKISGPCDDCGAVVEELEAWRRLDVPPAPDTKPMFKESEMKEAQAADTKSTNDGDGEAVASTDVARELVLSFGIEVAGLDGLTATSLVDGRLAVRLPPRISPAQAEAAIPVVQALLPYLLDVLKLRGVKVSTGGEHTAGCPNEGKATPSLQIGARVLVLASPGEPRLGGRRATIVARDNTREPIPEGAGSSCPPGRYEWLCDVDDFRPASIAEGPWFRSVDLVAVVE